LQHNTQILVRTSKFTIFTLQRYKKFRFSKQKSINFSAFPNNFYHFLPLFQTKIRLLFRFSKKLAATFGKKSRKTPQLLEKNHVKCPNFWKKVTERPLFNTFLGEYSTRNHTFLGEKRILRHLHHSE